MLTVEILRCPAHGFFAIAINSQRITPSKCCGRWKVFHTWPRVDPHNVTSALAGVPSEATPERTCPVCEWASSECTCKPVDYVAADIDRDVAEQEAESLLARVLGALPPFLRAVSVREHVDAVRSGGRLRGGCSR